MKLTLCSHLAALCSSLLLLLCASQGWAASGGAIAMPDRYSADAAARVLEDGGNAIDAAVAAAFVLAVTYPEAGNIGGGGFMLSVIDGDAQFLDFRERAPQAANRDMYLDEDGEFVQRASLIGGLASGVPGTVRGLQLAHTRYGSQPWSRLLQPAITLAREGFEVPAGLAAMAQGKIEETAGETNFAAHYGGMGTGKPFRQAALAATLERIAVDPEDFYRGVTARLLVAQMQRSGGLITLQDLADYRAQWREPLQLQWRDYTVLSAPPPSSGGIALLQLLALRDAIAPAIAGLEHNSAPYIHLLAELKKRAFADRAAYLGDPDHVDVPVAALLAPDYLAARAAGVDPARISSPAAVPPGLESPDTTHFSILDGEGNSVALTYTLNWDFGSGVVVEEAGFLLNNEMDDFSAKPGVPNAFGVIGNARNAIAPGKRMLSSMTPTILLQDGKPALIIGTPGGSTIFTSVFQVILNLYDFDMSLQAAVDATRFHHQLPEARVLRHDQRPISANLRLALEKMGYTVVPNDWGDLGDIQAIKVTEKGVETAADSRGRGVARRVNRTPEHKDSGTLVGAVLAGALAD
ncbi:gamma-glutamyltransferase [Haliea sp. E1-2-M8]|uniref:gamma-glutamyltransferase n=1 Tax=Haliea sp. E1-2-M8 TaxID=3064706 RepID=UPI002728E308|nr:gamma-glutamyltransferase [Haliea sp. E1-2-M8]MDO8863209.1 gamma-glutamyltransferase [Haliea sp. E1-2-M8]